MGFRVVDESFKQYSMKASCVGCREEVRLLRHRNLEMGKFDMRRDIDGEHDSVQGQACVGKSF